MRVKILVAFAFFVPLVALAQRNQMSLGVDVGLPNDNLSASAGTGFGVSFRYEYGLSNHLTAIGTVGAILFAKKSYMLPNPSPITSFSSKLDMVPLQVGAKYYLFNNMRRRQGIYISGELGIHMLFLKVMVNGSSQDVTNETDFSCAPGLGYQVGNLELSYRHQIVTGSGSSLNYSGFRAAYTIHSH